MLREKEGEDNDGEVEEKGEAKIWRERVADTMRKTRRKRVRKDKEKKMKWRKGKQEKEEEDEQKEENK